MMRTRPSLILLTLAVGAASLAGCSSSDGAAEELTYEDSPLSKFFGAGSADVDEEALRAESVAQQKKLEEVTASCMQEEGFDYTPVVVDESMFTASSGEEWNPDDREWVAQYGYGLVNYPGADQPAPDLGEDPNAAYVSSLSESEQTAYYEALYGPPQDVEDQDAVVEWDWTTAGCSGFAQNEVMPEGGTGSVDMAQFEDLMTAMNEMYSAQWENEEPTEPDQKWSACMTESGYSEFDRQVQAQESISAKLETLYSQANGDGTGEGDPEAEYVDPRTTPEGKKIAEEEVNLALVDLDCREKTDYAGEQLRLQFAAEEQFIAEHQEDLEAYKAAMEADQADKAEK